MTKHRWSEEDLDRAVAQIQKSGHLAVVPRGTSRRGKRHKYSARATWVDGYRFDSALEARRYEQLKLLQASGEVAWFTRKPRFDLAPGVTYVADFLVIWRANTTLPYRFGDTCYVMVEDTKGVETARFRLKLKLMADRYPNVRVQVLKRGDVGGA